jgi:hypothetical protein
MAWTNTEELERQLAEVTAERDKMRTYLQISEPNDDPTYLMPTHGWTCFHCGETFTTPNAARWHFGATPDAKPGCLLKVELGNERGWLARIRELETKEPKLYVWEPVGHGQETVTVVEVSFEKALAAANAFVEKECSDRSLQYHYHGWDTDYYQLTVHSIGQVVTHAND